MPASPLLIMAPIRGITDAVFRTAYGRCFGGIDLAIAPFVKTAKGQLKPSLLRELRPEVNRKMKLVPQVLSKEAAGFVDAAKKLEQLGYTEVNWNLGCPTPTTAKRGLGAGLLPTPDVVEAFLEQVCAKGPLAISIKTRLGYRDGGELERLVPVFNRFPLARVVIHPRTAAQHYSGPVDLEMFGACLEALAAPVVYSGEIWTAADVARLEERFPGVSGWMLGRGLVADPFLALEVRGRSGRKDLERFRRFHGQLVEGYAERLSGAAHVISRMGGIWQFMGPGLGVPERPLRKLVKSRTLGEYNERVERVLALQQGVG